MSALSNSGHRNRLISDFLNTLSHNRTFGAGSIGVADNVLNQVKDKLDLTFELALAFNGDVGRSARIYRLPARPSGSGVSRWH